MTANEIEQLLMQHERNDLEFKQRLTRDTPRAIVAMANGTGGLIVVGVSDSVPRRIVGLDVPFDQAEGEILSGLRDRVKPALHPLPILEWVSVGDKNVLVIHVAESQIKGLTINGHRLVRHGSRTEQASREEEVRMFQASREISFERSFVPEASYENLNHKRVDDYLRTRLSETSRLEERAQKDWLVSLGLVRAGDYVPTVAALVLFGEYPPRFLPQCEINAIRFAGRDKSTNVVIDRQRIDGAAAEMIEQAILFVRRNMRIGGVIGGLYREDVPEYPEEAVREAVINAVVHRDYSLAQKTQLFMYDDRLEIENPGGLPSGITLDELLAHPHPYPRNPLLARTLYEFWRGRGFIEEAGSGIPRIRRVMRELGSAEPIFAAEPLWFRVTLPSKVLREIESQE